MPQTGNSVAIAFLIIIVALFSAIVMPELFNNLANMQDSSNSGVMQSTRILIVIAIVFLIGGSAAFFVGATNE